MARFGGRIGSDPGKGIVGVEGTASNGKVAHARDRCACVLIGLCISVLNRNVIVGRFALDEGGAERGAAKINGENTTR